MNVRDKARKAKLLEDQGLDSSEDRSGPRIATIRPPVRDFGLEADALLTVQEVAELLKVPVSWVYEHTRKRGLDRLPHLKLGKYLRFEEQAVREFLERQRRV